MMQRDCGTSAAVDTPIHACLATASLPLHGSRRSLASSASKAFAGKQARRMHAQMKGSNTRSCLYVAAARVESTVSASFCCQNASTLRRTAARVCFHHALNTTRAHLCSSSNSDEKQRRMYQRPGGRTSDEATARDAMHTTAPSALLLRQPQRCELGAVLTVCVASSETDKRANCAGKTTLLPAKRMHVTLACHTPATWYAAKPHAGVCAQS
jgi:hypothetical protein